MNKNEIMKMLEYSGIAYRDNRFTENDEKIFIVNDKNTDVSYQIRIKKEVMTIAFRGSDSKRDWNFNLDFCKKIIPYGNSCSDIKIHSGFLKAYKSKNVRDKIRSFVTENIRKIKLTGHSYGAALAIICAIDLQYNFEEKDYEVIVFGCPRVGNSAFKKSYDKRIFKTLRVENKGDIITKVPLWIMGYRHVGGRLLLGRKFLKLPCMNNHMLQEYYSNIWDV